MPLWQWRQTYLQRHPHLAAAVDAFLHQAVGWSRLNTLMQRDPPNTDGAQVIHLWQQHLQTGIPIPYLLGRVAWRQLDLLVSPAVLIPRPETELLVDLALEWLGSQDGVGIWADLGTGSGAVALGLAEGIPKVLGVDSSGEALAVARRNLERHQKQDHILLYQGSWFEPLAAWRGSLQGVVSNPPYIPTAMLPTLDGSVRDYEPHLALDGGPTGLEAIAVLVDSAPHYLQPGGFWVVEVMMGQAETVAARLAKDGRYHQIRITPDLAGIPRFVSAVCRPS